MLLVNKYLTRYYLGPDQVMPSDANIVQDTPNGRICIPLYASEREKCGGIRGVCSLLMIKFIPSIINESRY